MTNSNDFSAGGIGPEQSGSLHTRSYGGIVRYGSLADIVTRSGHVRFAPPDVGRVRALKPVPTQNPWICDISNRAKMSVFVSARFSPKLSTGLNGG
jgi:hypothetical protein